MRGRLVAVLALLALAPAGSAPAGSALAATTDPGGSGGSGATVAVTPDRAEVGDGVQVTLTGWPQGVVEVGVCGNEARRGSADCDVSAARAVGIPAQVVRPPVTVLRLAAPPVACPCVVRAVHREAGLVAAAPVALAGVKAAAAAAGAPATRSVRLDAARLTRDEDGDRPTRLREWFGVRAGRELAFTVTNTGTTTLTDPVWSATAGREGRTGEVLVLPALGTLEPGANRLVRVPVTLDGPVFGGYEVSVAVDGLDAPATFRETTAVWPWGLPAAVAAAALLLAAAARGQSAVRSRRERRRRAKDVARNSSTAAAQAPTKSRA